jgi:hypothetical protein
VKPVENQVVRRQTAIKRTSGKPGSVEKIVPEKSAPDEQSSPDER